MLSPEEEKFVNSLGFSECRIVLEDCAPLINELRLNLPEKSTSRRNELAQVLPTKRRSGRKRKQEKNQEDGGKQIKLRSGRITKAPVSYDERPSASRQKAYVTRSVAAQLIRSFTDKERTRSRVYIEDDEESKPSTSQKDADSGFYDDDQMDTDDEVIAAREMVARKEAEAEEKENAPDEAFGIPSIEPLVEDKDAEQTNHRFSKRADRRRQQMIRLPRPLRRDPENCPCEFGTKKYFLHIASCVEGQKIQKITTDGHLNAANALITIGEATKTNAVLVNPGFIYDWRDIFLNVLHIHDLVSDDDLLLDLNIDEFTQLVVLTDVLFVCIRSSAVEYFDRNVRSIMQLVRISDCLPQVIETYELDVSVFPGDVLGGFFGSNVFALQTSRNFVEKLKVFTLNEEEDRLVELGEYSAKMFHKMCFSTLIYPMVYGFPIASRGCPDFSKLIQHNLCTQQTTYMQLKKVPKFIVVPDASIPSVPHAWAPTRFFAYVGYLDGSAGVICLNVETTEWSRLPIALQTPVRRLLYTEPNVLVVEARRFKKFKNPTMTMHRFIVDENDVVTPLPNIPGEEDVYVDENCGATPLPNSPIDEEGMYADENCGVVPLLNIPIDEEEIPFKADDELVYEEIVPVQTEFNC